MNQNELWYLLKDPAHTQEQIAILTSVVGVPIYLFSTSVITFFYMLKGVSLLASKLFTIMSIVLWELYFRALTVCHHCTNFCAHHLTLTIMVFFRAGFRSSTKCCRWKLVTKNSHESFFNWTCFGKEFFA